MTEDMLLHEVNRVTSGRQGPRKLRRRSLGWCIFVLAIADYQRGTEEFHRDAKRFLYPKTVNRRDQFEWAVSVAEGLDTGWMREVLDRRRSQWKREREERGEQRATQRPQAS